MRADVKTVEEALARPGRYKSVTGEEHTKAVCKVVTSKRFGKYLMLDARNFPRIDQSKVKKEARLDGKYLLRTSDDTLSPEDAALGYKQLLEVEDAFRTLKSTLDLRPMYHRVYDRIRTQLERICIVEIDAPEGKIAQRTNIAPYSGKEYPPVPNPIQCQ